MVLISNCLTITLKNYLSVLKVPNILASAEISHTQRPNSPLSACPNVQFMVWVDAGDSHNQQDQPHRGPLMAQEPQRMPAFNTACLF